MLSDFNLGLQNSKSKPKLLNTICSLHCTYLLTPISQFDTHESSHLHTALTQSQRRPGTHQCLMQWQQLSQRWQTSHTSVIFRRMISSGEGTTDAFNAWQLLAVGFLS